MNPTQAQRYLESGGDHCPECGGTNTWDNYSPYKDRDRGCYDCNKRWIDKYALVGVDEFTKEGGE